MQFYIISLILKLIELYIYLTSEHTWRTFFLSQDWQFKMINFLSKPVSYYALNLILLFKLDVLQVAYKKNNIYNDLYGIKN